MKFDLIKNDYNNLLKCELNSGDAFLAEAGSMMYMSDNIKIFTNEDPTNNARSLNEQVSTMEDVKSEFSCDNSGYVYLAPGSPGKILEVDLNNSSIIADGISFLAGNKELEYTKMGNLQGLLWGTGLFLEKISGTGKVFFKCFGDYIEVEVKAGEKIDVDTGHLIAFETSLEYNILKPDKGRFDQFAAGEWIVVEFAGPGKIWLNARNRSEFAKSLNKFLPKKK